ncbi:FAD-dependent oxidoreductase [Methylobacterium gossipiicola]|uniref:2-polyprenyl-6-methoxyphenol hydroxylase n=1 Tax=Methylobacterium gossipiicola TaxID=582675 RepID=A0A1I2SSH9_9HYPH|nr:NAD(P)/FAD-dependent oxidoreductase [Methylobacterium gossipiicola]SFG55628.1 2-polyprenyl-6-methoxyphenol hydroxylase [Methylobacterium gossipiicola]
MTSHPYDAIIIGAGLAGTSAAHKLATAGHRVALIDIHAVYPPDFRAEKLGQVQMDQFDRLGLGWPARNATTMVNEVWVSRFQRLVSHLPIREYGLHYANLVNAIRQALPASVALTLGRVKDIETGPERQSVTLGDGQRLEGRLIVLATGLGDALRRKLGIGKQVVGPKHSVSFGFDLAAPPSAFPFPSLTLYGDAFRSRIAYVTLFPIGTTMRGNLFVYRDPSDPWIKSFRASPEAILRAELPGLLPHCPDLTIRGPVEMRPVDLVQAQDYRRDGVVLIGDAFLSPCPIPGTGIGKVLTDVERLCAVHLPRWLETPGMEAEKLGSFYDDPVKVASDTQCLRASHYSRAIATEIGPIWAARRWRNYVGRHAIHALRGVRSRLAGLNPTGHSAPST